MTNEELIKLYSRLKMGRAVMEHMKKTTKFYKRGDPFAIFIASGYSYDSCIVNIKRVSLVPSQVFSSWDDTHFWSGKN